MKKTISLILTVMLLVLAVTPVMAEAPLKVLVGGKKIDFDVNPQIINERTMVPLRAIFEALGASVEWYGETRTVVSTKGGTTIKLTIDDATMYVNDVPVTLDSPACIVDDRTLVPVRAISEAFKLKVDWLGEHRLVKVIAPVSVETESSYAKTYNYDDNGNITYVEFVDGTWEKSTYDVFSNMTYTENSEGAWEKNTYDENDNLIQKENSKGVIINWTYDERGNATYREYNNGAWTKFYYNEKGDAIYSENSNDTWIKVDYDENGNPVYKEDSYYGTWVKSEYDENGNAVKHEYSNGLIVDVTYNEAGQPVIYQGSDGSWEKSTYDAAGNEIRWDASNGAWEKWTYDADGNLTSNEDSTGVWIKFTVKNY